MLSLPRLPVLLAGCRGPLPTCCGRGCAGVGAQHCPFGLHALRGAACHGGGGRPSEGGWPSTVVRGIWCQALSVPRSPVPWGGQPAFRGPVRASRARLVWAWGRSTSPTACALASRRCALWGWREGVPGGGALRRCEGRLSSGPLPPPAARPLGGLSRSATLVLWAWVSGRGGPALSLLACMPCEGLRAAEVVGGRAGGDDLPPL